MSNLKIRGKLETNTGIMFKDGTIQTTAAIFYNGSFEDTTTQVSAGTTSANAVRMNITSLSNGLYLDTGVTDSKIYFLNSGNYYVSFVGQFRFSGGASSYIVKIWYAKNGINVPNSAREFTLTSAQNSLVLSTLQDIITIQPGDFIQFFWWTPVAPSAGPNGIYLWSDTASVGPPAIPAATSVSVNILNVDP